MGIVYASDARVEDSVSVIATFPEGSQHADHAARRDHGTKRASARAGLPRFPLLRHRCADLARIRLQRCRLMLEAITTWLGPDEWQAVRLSLRVSFWATLVSLPLGIFVAYALARWEFHGKQVLNGLVHMPLILPPGGDGVSAPDHPGPARIRGAVSRSMVRRRRLVSLDGSGHCRRGDGLSADGARHPAGHRGGRSEA